MSDKVSELAQLALVETSKSFSERWDRVPRAEFMAVYNQKFADQLIKECLEALRLVPYSSFEIEFGEEIPFQDAVRKHFGVSQ